MADFVEQAVEYVRNRSFGGPLPTRLRVSVNFHPDAVTSETILIAAIAREGLYRSQFETGTSNGGLTAYRGGDRWQWESRVFGGAYDNAAPSQRPKYGALNYLSDPVGGSRRFGSCHLRLHPTVLARTTFCYPDSHLHPAHFGVADRMMLVEMASKNPFGLELLDDYVEAQIHGPLRIAEDVEAVVLDSCYRGTHVEDVAHRLPCAMEWHDGFILSIRQIGNCVHYRGEAVADPLAAMAANGVVTPRQIGEARLAGMDDQLAKWCWHCVARFGRSAPI